MSLNLTEAWKDVPPPSPSGTQDSAEAASGPPPAPDYRASFLLSPGAEAQQTAPLLGAFGNVQEATDAKDRENSLLSAFPRQAATPLSPAHPRSLFDSPLTLPLLPSSAPSVSAYKPDPQRIEELHALILHNKQDPELAALLERNPAFRAQAALDDGSMPARALLGQQILREIAGEKYAGEPGFYFLALKEKLPEAATRQEAYAAVYDHYSKVVDNQYEENRKRRAAYQNNRAQVEEAVAHVVSGLWSPSDLTARLTPEQLGVYQKEFDTTAIEKAHAAFSFLKQAFSDTPDAGLRRMVSERTAMKITSALSDDDGSGKLTINETAFQLFEGSLKNLMGQVKEETGKKYQFLHNLKIALFNPAIKRDATLGTALQLSGQQDLLVPFAREHNKQVFGLMAQTVRDYETYVKNDKENARVLGLLSTGQDLGNQASDRASFAARTVNCLGSVTGQTLPFFIPYAGWGVALVEAFDDKRNRAYYAGLQPGTAEWSAFIDAAASVAVEKISYGGIGRLSGAGWLMGKLPFMNKTRQALTDSLWKHVLFETGAGIAEETVAEPTAEAIIQWVVRNNLAPLVNLNVGGNYDWNNYWQELQGMLSPDQFAATALFVGGLAGMQAPSLHRSLITYSKNEEMLMTQGIPKEEARRIAAIENDKERIAAARQARGKAWENYEQAAKNAKAGMAAFRHLGEVQATIESEAYKYFQQSMHLPLVEEKLDKPGTYAVTVYDRDSGKKKFTQDMTGDQLVALFGQYFSRAEQQEVRKTQSEFAANAILRSAEATGEIQAQDMLQWGQDNNKDGRNPEAENASTPRQPQTEAPVQDTPSPAQQEKTAPASSDTQETAVADSAPAQKTETETAASLTTLGGFVRAIGAMSQTAFTHLTRIATQEYRRRTDSGMSEQEAAATPFAALSPYVPLSSIMALDQEFGQRLRIGAKTTGEENFKYTRLFKMRTAPGTTPADTLFLLTRGNIGSRELLEDLFEWKLGKITLKDPVRLQAIASLLRDTQASMRQLGFKGQFVEPKGELSDMQIVEAMSKLALSDMLSNADSLPLPQWQKDLLQYHVNTLGDAAYLLHIGQAYNAGRKAGAITQDMADILRDLGHEVHTVFDSAKIEQADIQAVMDARAIIDGRAPSGTPTASQIRERQQKDAEEEKAHITTGDKGKERSVPKEAYRHPETISLPEAPSSMQGVFANGASWNPDAGTWLGLVPVDKLHLSPEVPQVKVNSGKKGVVNPLVGDYRADAPPIYVWKRKNGRLEVVSGRHRLDLAQRTGTKNIPAYVYEEDAAHDAKWARLLDYEQNMQDDQADELTAAIYVRETNLTDAELTRRGLTRSGTKSRRGLLIGREAREDLWTRFKSGAIRAQDAEAICLLTQHIQDKARIDAMQTAAANDLARGKSLEFVAAKIQLMAHASADGKMVQGLISFGESFEADMEKAAEYVSLCITTINEHINAIKGVRTISKKGSVLVTEGITAGLSADPAERLKELELLKAMYEKIGLYENLRVRALTWDGHTPPDPIGDHRLDMQAERARAEEEAAAQENEENRKASEALTPELTFSLTPSRDLETTFPSLWGQAARELNARGQVSFSLNGSRVAIHTLSEEKMRHVLELGGMPNPAIQIADLDSGPTYYAEIACILHPDRIDPAKTPGARIWRGDAWTRQMPEKISEDGAPWEGYEHGPEEIPWFYNEHGDLREWNRENLDAYMKAKHLESFLPHNMTPDEVLDNYGTDGAALPIIMASQAYAAEFPSLKEALRTDNLSFQLDRHEAETATRQLEDQFKILLGSCYFEPRSLQHFLIGYWWRDISHENVRNALIGEGLLDDPDTVYDEEENPEEYNDLQSSNDYIAEEVRAFLDACRTSAKIYYEAAPGGWLFPSDFSGFILPSSLGPSLRSELEKYNVPIHTYDLTEQEALTLGNPWTLAKASWLREEVDERRNEAIRSFLEVHDISFSLSGAEERDDPSAFLPHSSPSPDFPLALSPVRLSSSFHAVEQASPVTLAIPASAREDKTQGFSKLARQAFTALREKTRQRTLFANGREKTSEQFKPPLLMPDGRRIYLSNRGWKHIMATSPETRTLAAIGALEPLLASARYMYSVPEFDNASPDQTKSWHYYLAKIRDSLHGPGYVLFTFREDTRGCYLEGVETAAALDKTGSASSQVDFGATRRATGRSLPVRTLLSLKQFVNFIDKGGVEAFRAPNGQPSRLAPDQWHLVRTAPFMRYFGDWLRDPSASSVVLDDNGEPRVCYRGLKQSYNPGVRRNYTWISSSRELSEQYAAGGTVLDLFVATRRPFHFPDSLTRQSPEHFRENIRRQLEQDRALGFFSEEQLQEASRKLETLLQGTEETEAFKIWERHRELKDILSSLGYDSVMTEESGVMTYGLFRPGQAKSAVGNCGSYDITLSDITFALTPREQRTAAQALVEDTFLRAPDGTPTALTERQWLQVNSAAFKKWFGQSKVVNAHGEPVIVYHGTARKDRVGTVFRPERATSGPMAFFADSPEIASNYSRNKTDTSIDYEEENYQDYKTQFRVTFPSGRDIPLERYWNYLSPEERQRIARTAGHIRTDWEGDDSIILDPSTDEANGGFRFHLQEARGNALRALVYHWLDSATLFGQEARFLDVLSKLDLPIAPWYRDPDYTEPGVYACYLHMEHPFRTNGITGKILTSLKAASRKAGNPAQKGGLLSWSKNDLAPETWIDILEEDVKNGTTYAWTTIPDWVTACLKRLGYDGIIDQGGKFHSDIHTVYIPFSPYQLKSATDNNGSFDSGNPDITFALSPEERLITEQAKADGTWLQAPNGQPSLLEPKLWATVRTRAFRDWFGDWLRAPEQSSRVVDVNGEPLPVYHGSHRAGFTIFDTALGENPSQFGTPDDCYFFSDSRQVAITYCKLEDPASAREAELPALSVLAGQRTLFPAVYTCFINIRLPLEADFQGNYWDGRDAEDTSGEGDVPTTNTIALEAREQGYDAAIIRNVIDMGDDAPYHLPSTVYSVFDPSQIKSAYANRGTFDSGNPDITFSLWDDAEDSYTVMERSASPLTAEEQSILARARDEGNDLLAPNGQPTRLTEKQWAQSRTKAFLAWFGDWLHDPANSSKTLDENGEPIVLYHGGSFDIRRSPSVFDGVPHVDGIFFSDSTELAKSYQAYQGGGITTAWLNLKNPFLAQDEASARLPWVDEFIDFWQEEEGWTDRYSGESMDRESVRDMIREGSLYEYDMGQRWSDFLGWVREHHDGYLGHDPTDMGALIAVAFKSTQVKSSEYNSGAFSASEPDITFSLSNLAAIHSLDEEKFLAVDKLGGLPLPSIAVTRLDRPYTWGGEENIYLVGSPALADPVRGVEIHDRDAWSGYFPELRWSRQEEKEREDFYKQAQEAALRYYGGTDISSLRFLKNALDGDHRGELENKLRHNDFSLAVFAAERGYSPRPVTAKIPGRLNTGDKIFYAEIRKMLPWKDANTLSPDRQDDFCKAMERAIERYRSQFSQDSRDAQLTVPQTLTRKSNLRAMEKELREARGDGFQSISYLALQDARQAGKKALDSHANYKRFEKYAAQHKKAFNAWVEDKLARWLNPVPRIRETGLPATLENITRHMLESKGMGAERGLVFSTGLLRARQARRFNSLEEIKASRNNLVTTEEEKASQQKAQDLIHQFQMALSRIDGSFSAFDNAVKALSLVRGAPTPQKVLAALCLLYRGTSFQGRIARDSRLPGLGSAALSALHAELRDYYEAVPRRSVQLREFSHAVLPAALRKNKQVRDVLKRHQIRPLYHDGTREGRFQALASLIGSSASFSLAPGPSWLRLPDSDYMASLSEEERAITETALASGAWLKAPNGEPSRLTPRQWAQVRTAAFRDWFGDWQHDPAHASRVVDENGEPRVVYHGTHRAGFTVFDSRKGNPSSGIPAGSSFFTADPEVAASYYGTREKADLRSPLANTGAPGIYSCFLNFRSPLEEDFGGLWWYEKGEPWFDLYDKQSGSYISPPDGGEYWTSEQAAIDYISSHGLTDYMLIRIFSSRTIHTVVEEAKLLHRDGAVIHNVIDPGDDTGNKVTDTYVALHPSQIKSATDNIGTFDPSSPDITFSVIGPHAATWGQYKENTFRGRDDGKPRAEIDASRAALKDRAAPYLPTLRRELSALRHTLSAETKKRIARYLSLHRQFYRNKRTLRPENNISKWREYLTLDHDRESWERLLSAAVLRTGPLAASGLAEQVSSLELLLREDDGLLQSLATLAAVNTALPLDAWLDYPELFAAYPALRSMPVILQHLSGYLGMYSPAERAIYIHRNLDDPQQLRSILLHEVQHAIQHIEGFAWGGTRESAKLFYESMREAAYEAYDQASRFMSWLNARDGMISTLEYMLSLARNPRRVLRTSYRYSYDGISHRLTGEERILDMARYALKDLSGLLEQFYDRSWSTDSQFELPWPGNYALNIPAGIKECLAAAKATPSRRLAYRRTPKPDMAALHRDFLKYERLSSLSPYELYRRLAGEIEACAVERRSGLSAGERAESPFNDALEYPGEALVSFSPLSGPAGTTFSLTSLEEIVSGLAAPSMHVTRASELVKDFGKAAENWRRVMSGKEEKPSARVGAELFGMINSLLSSARYVLPKGYRSNVDLQMQWASVYAAMAESGEIPPKGTLRSGDSFYKKFETSMINATTSAATPEEVRQILASIGSQRLDHVMSKVLDRVRTQLVYFAKDELYQKTMRRVEAVYPKKEPGKKSPRGRLEAAAYRTLARYRQMLDAQSQAKAEAMTTLEALYNQEEDEEKRQEHERDILAWKTYGDYAGMSLPQAREAMEKLLEFILSGRNSWERKLTREAGRIKYAARQIQKNLPAVNSGSSRAGAKISHRTKLRKLLASLPYSFMSYAQLMLALEPVLGQRFSRARIKEITEANASLLNASNDRSAWLSDTIRRIAGVKSESAAEQWLVQFNTPQATGIPIAPVLTVKVSLSIEDAQEWLSLSSQEREARRQAIREEDRRTETLTENVPGEEDIPLLRQALDEYESRTPEQRQYQHNVTSKREVPNTEAASQLICSRDCALYAILLHEQPDYADVYDSEGNLIRKGFLRREGLDDKGIGDLYDYVGPDGLEYGYALRRKLNETGLTLAQVYEERMGVPFTLKPDYFRATFDRNSTREKDALTEPKTGSIGGGKYGLLIDRVVHSENLDFSKSGTLVFLAAAAEQDNYIYTSHITTAWRALLKNKPLEQKLKQHLGEDMMGKLSSWMDLIDGASLENNRAFLNLSRMQGMLQKAFAISVLAGNGYVLLKQATAILHGFFAGWVPSAILEKADGTRELAHKHISFSSFLFHLAASKLGLGDIAMKEVAATPYFTARMRGEGAMLAQLGNQMPGQRYSRMEKLPEKSMDLIEAVDVKANLLAMHALANAYYARSRSLNRENGSPFTDEELRQAALEQVGMSLELGAQPLTKTQKSMSQAAGGILSKLAFVMKSEQLNKIGLMAAEWKTGSARNRVCAAQSWLALGVTSSLLAWFIAWIKGMEDDDGDKAKKWKKYGATALLGDLTTIPLAGEGVNYLASLFTGEHVFADSYARTLIDVQGIARTITREYEHVADKKEMDWDTHFNNLTALVRAAGVGGAFSRSSSAIVSSYGALSLSAATGANISRTAKDLLTRLFGTPEEDRKKKRKRKSGKNKKEN